MAGSIGLGTDFGTHVQIHLEMVMGEIKITPCDLGGIWGVLGAPNLAHMCGFIWEWTLAKNN